MRCVPEAEAWPHFTQQHNALVFGTDTAVAIRAAHSAEKSMRTKKVFAGATVRRRSAKNMPIDF